MVLVAHRLSTVMNAHKIAVVHAGNIIEQVVCVDGVCGCCRVGRDCRVDGPSTLQWDCRVVSLGVGLVGSVGLSL